MTHELPIIGAVTHDQLVVIVLVALFLLQLAWPREHHHDEAAGWPNGRVHHAFGCTGFILLALLMYPIAQGIIWLTLDAWPN